MIIKKTVISTILLIIAINVANTNTATDDSYTQITELSNINEIYKELVDTNIAVENYVPENKLNKPTYGSATWYGGSFHGNKTYSGDVFNKYSLTAAHNSLPMGTKVRVTNTLNGKSVIVKINDKGNFTKYGIAMDLSEGAFAKISNKKRGRIKIKMEVIDG